MLDIPSIVYAQTLDCGVSVTITRYPDTYIPEVADRYIPEVASKDRSRIRTTNELKDTRNMLLATRWILAHISEVI